MKTIKSFSLPQGEVALVEMQDQYVIGIQNGNTTHHVAPTKDLNTALRLFDHFVDQLQSGEQQDGTKRVEHTTH